MWESLVTTAILAGLVSLFLNQLTYHQRQLRTLEQQAQALSVATMCLQTGQTELHQNHQRVMIRQTDKQTIIRANGKELLRVTLLSP
ncbi:hypothetical protein MKL29_07940 [Streptococcus suis]|nr:hypothetical protein [Streptococcus suis]